MFPSLLQLTMLSFLHITVENQLHSPVWWLWSLQAKEVHFPLLPWSGAWSDIHQLDPLLPQSLVLGLPWDTAWLSHLRGFFHHARHPSAFHDVLCVRLCLSPGSARNSRPKQWISRASFPGDREPLRHPLSLPPTSVLAGEIKGCQMLVPIQGWTPPCPVLRLVSNHTLVL